MEDGGSMRERLTQPIEDYLKAIYAITRQQPRASTNQIAEALKITPASVTGMLKKLAETDPPLVDYQRHHGAALTPQGERVALEVLRHHRLLEMFLHQILGYAWDEVHVEADQLEHFISEKFEEQISKALGDPSHDPHGDPIPGRDLSLPGGALTALLALRPGQAAVVQRVNSADPQLLRHLGSLGLVPGAQVRVLTYSEFDRNLTIQIGGAAQDVVLGPAITQQVFVQPAG
ncbi:MAG: metal-dependent transcriptional regulator [Chloroflexota bacterium]